MFGPFETLVREPFDEPQDHFAQLYRGDRIALRDVVDRGEEILTYLRDQKIFNGARR